MAFEELAPGGHPRHVRLVSYHMWSLTCICTKCECI
jgi:hypothetical protein